MGQLLRLVTVLFAAYRGAFFGAKPQLALKSSPLASRIDLLWRVTEASGFWGTTVLPWNKQELEKLDALQVTLLAAVLRTPMKRAELTIDFLKRRRHVAKAWIQLHYKRWSTVFAERHLGYLGHTVRGNGLVWRIVRWKDTNWWRQEQILIDILREVWRRHPGCGRYNLSRTDFLANLLQQQLSERESLELLQSIGETHPGPYWHHWALRRSAWRGIVKLWAPRLQALRSRL